MSDAWRVASIQSFEQVQVAPATALLRVTAVSALPPSGGDRRPTLAADDGHEVVRFAAIPAPADKGGLLRCAYSVSAPVLAGETVFSLEFDDGLVIALPAPIAGAARLGRHTGPREVLAAGAPPAETEERRSELTPKLTELSRELASARRELGGLRTELGGGAQARFLHLHLEAVEARAELQALRDLATLAAGELSEERAQSLELLERVAELETWTEELERRLAETTTQLADARGATYPASPEPDWGPRTVDEAELAEISHAAVTEAHRTAERDLADAAS